MRPFLFLLLLTFSCAQKPELSKMVSKAVMEEIYEEVKTPYKYGVVFQHPDSTKMVDSPTIFRENNQWYMTYIVFDGQGYETWMAESEDLLHWESLGKILPFTEGTWDENQKAGYPALINTSWEGDYNWEKFDDNYWMTYLGGSSAGYEAGTLKIGLASNSDLSNLENWDTSNEPLLSPEDSDVRWFENKTIYKSHVIRDEEKLTGYPFVMYYNAKGDTADYESIGMAVSNDLKIWKRFGENPVITKNKGICGDAQIVKIDNLYVMFYFGAFWKPGAFERFACSYDLVNWTVWEGPDLIAPSEPFDQQYAHKPWVIKWEGTVYHFYNAVGDQGRVIALATSRDLKK